MTATYTFDVFSSIDGYGSYNENGDWGGYWSKEGPEFLEHRLAVCSGSQRMVLGANTFRTFLEMLGPIDNLDPVNSAMKNMPTTVVSNSLHEPLAWPDATVAKGDPVEVVRHLKEESKVPPRSHGSMTLNRALLSAGLVDMVQLTLFPVITGETGDHPVLDKAGDFDLELIEARTFDGRIQELLYRPTPHIRSGQF